MLSHNDVRRFTGDIAFQDELSTNAKGGSLTATLKKGIAAALGYASGVSGGPAQNRLAAATVDVDPFNSVILMASMGGKAQLLHVRRTGAHSVEIFVDDQDDPGIDEISASFVELKRQQFVRQELRLSEPMDADEFEAMTDKAIAAAEARYATP